MNKLTKQTRTFSIASHSRVIAFGLTLVAVAKMEFTKLQKHVLMMGKDVNIEYGNIEFFHGNIEF